MRVNWGLLRMVSVNRIETNEYADKRGHFIKVENAQRVRGKGKRRRPKIEK